MTELNILLCFWNFSLLCTGIFTAIHLTVFCPVISRVFKVVQAVFSNLCKFLAREKIEQKFHDPFSDDRDIYFIRVKFEIRGKFSKI